MSKFHKHNDKHKIPLPLDLISIILNEDATGIFNKKTVENQIFSGESYKHILWNEVQLQLEATAMQ